MAAGGRLTIAVRHVLDGAPAVDRDVGGGDLVLVAVTDTGVGMDAEVQSHLFEPFFTTKERGKGTGLGLSTVFGVVQAAGGQVRVTSAPGRGTEFRIYLPPAPGDEASAASPSALAGLPRGTETVLVVEDEPTVRDLVARVLGRLGYRVVEAARGAEALERCERDPAAVDLVVSDIVMPGGMSGRDLADRLAGLRPPPRVLLISGYESARRGSDATLPSTPLLKKPFSPPELARRVRELLDAPREDAGGRAT
jgi:CheY-like chemotaxis protein